MKKLILAICLAMLSIGVYADEVKPSTTATTQKTITYQIDGNKYTQLEFDKLVKEQPTMASKPCTVTVVVQGSINGVPFRHEEKVTFEASWFECLVSKVAAFLVEAFT